MSDSRLQVVLPPKLVPVFSGPAMYRGAFGGRGSGKTRTFAKMTAVFGMRWGKRGVRGQIACGRQFLNSIDESSFAEVKAAILEEPALNDYYECGTNYIKSRDGLIEYVFVGLKRNVESLKSKARLLLLWIDEAEAITEDVWVRVDPTVREAEAEIWVTWNPARNSRREKDGTITGSATDWRFRKEPPPESKIVQINWRDNPWFGKTILPKKREHDAKTLDVGQYDHIWEGGYLTAVAGSYYGVHLAEARRAGRITQVTSEPLLTKRVYVDIGGTGATADAFCMIISQNVGTAVRILNSYEAIGQQIADHVHWLTENGCGPDTNVQIILPHDGLNHEKVTRITYKSAFEAAGYRSVRVFEDARTGIARIRIDAGRNLFPSIYFNEATTEGLRLALGWYHERIDTERSIGMGPLHDWSSHFADTFGLLCMDYKPPRVLDIPSQHQDEIDGMIV